MTEGREFSLEKGTNCSALCWSVPVQSGFHTVDAFSEPSVSSPSGGGQGPLAVGVFPRWKPQRQRQLCPRPLGINQEVLMGQEVTESLVYCTLKPGASIPGLCLQTSSLGRAAPLQLHPCFPWAN